MCASDEAPEESFRNASGKVAEEIGTGRNLAGGQTYTDGLLPAPLPGTFP